MDDDWGTSICTIGIFKGIVRCGWCRWPIIETEDEFLLKRVIFKSYIRCIIQWPSGKWTVWHYYPSLSIIIRCYPLLLILNIWQFSVVFCNLPTLNFWQGQIVGWGGTRIAHHFFPQGFLGFLMIWISLLILHFLISFSRKPVPIWVPFWILAARISKKHAKYRVDDLSS